MSRRINETVSLNIRNPSLASIRDSSTLIKQHLKKSHAKFLPITKSRTLMQTRRSKSHGEKFRPLRDLERHLIFQAQA